MFKTLINQFRSLKKLRHLKLLNFHSFISYEKQSFFIDELYHFRGLRYLEIEHPEFCLSHKFFVSLSNLEDLELFRLYSNSKVDKNLIQKSHNFSCLENVKLI